MACACTSLKLDGDPNPGRIVTAPIDLKVGMRYVVTATAEGGISNPANWVEAGPSGNTKRTVVELDPVYRKALTAGQTFYWGVDVVKKTGSEWERASSTAPASSRRR